MFRWSFNTTSRGSVRLTVRPKSKHLNRVSVDVVRTNWRRLLGMNR